MVKGLFIMRKLQFLHEKEAYPRRFTIAMEVPTRTELINSLLKRERILVNTGISYVHPKDRYIKKVGREVALADSKEVPLYVLSAVAAGPKETFITALSETGTELVFVVCPESETPFLIKGTLL